MSSTNPLHDRLDDTFPQATNPYAATREVTPPQTAASRVGKSPAASQNRRLLNFIIDNILTRVLAYVGGGLLVLAYLSVSGPVQEGDEIGLWIFSVVVQLLLFASYFIILEGLFGITIGKLVTGTRVVNATGGKASWGQIVGRTFARAIPLEPLSFLFGDTTTGWHDTLSGTRVVRSR